MTRWSIAETKDLVSRVYGASQLSRVESSLYAMSQRQLYARYHFQESQRLLAEFRGSCLKDDILLTISHGSDQKARSAFEEFMMKAGAHAVAAVLSVHAMADVAAFAVYSSLGYRNATRLQRERDVSAASMQSHMAANPTHAVIAEALLTLTSDSAFKHIAALSNHSKHRGLIKPLLNEDWTGTRERPYEIRFAAFTYDEVSYPEAEITSVLGPAYELASATIVTVGNEINALLANNAA